MAFLLGSLSARGPRILRQAPDVKAWFGLGERIDAEEAEPLIH
jgi:hypothetical protein